MPRSTKSDTDSSLRQHLIALLEGGNAHATFDESVKNMPPKCRGVRPQAANGDLLPYSAWELLEHIRLAQWDILEFSRDRTHKSPDWPKGYWPKSPEPPTAAAWDKSIKQIRAETKAFIALVKNPKTDLHAKISWGDGQTILREILLVADHNAYHIGEFIAVRRMLGCWK